MPQNDQSSESLVSLLQEAGKQVDDLRILLDKVSPLILMLRGTYETVKPVLDGYFYFKGKIDGIAKFLQADLPDTEATRQAVTEYL